MNLFIIGLLMMSMSENLFDPESNAQWIIVNDGVMGGLSQGEFLRQQNGHGVFQGRVSLENNGGFSSVRCRIERKSISGAYFMLNLKGDGKKYQFRVKPDSDDRHSYIYQFETTGDWQELKIPMNQMIPRFRGNDLDLPNYKGDYLEEMAFLIANKEAEDFRLEIKQISVEK